MTAHIPGPIRSALYLPASNARAIAKARDLPCDAVILDLEDAVAPDRKAEARAMAVDAVKAGGFGKRTLVVRVNGLDTEWGEDDFAALREAQPDAILIPKVSAPDDLAAARSLIGADGPPLWAMIETCRGMLQLAAICGAAAANRLEVLVAGTNDLAKDMRCTPGEMRAPLSPLLTQIVVAARAFGLAALDGVMNAIDDTERLKRECRQGADLGFDGKSLVHPGQIAVANAVFAPSDERVAWARAVVAAFADPETSGRGAIRLGDTMVERLHLAEAQAVLAITSMR
ncbi:(3S)-malyl-CoA thioesterase [Sphingomonas sp. EC-HK361]|uniref:HpcH/HpaI aldolase/citrate lyase family protein n=1 Tax=Sphingomonas sp. EC-HK361 TaxID=2038397 RepID=UPI0012580E4B|nr:CoA ester lyase [Sphingomonas sp. EC-HK361]VVT20002.1 (3S)-malyl-CoA thioesterase [Sphingomonas sp. EC-HK361]